MCRVPVSCADLKAILTPFQVLELFETVVPPSKRMEINLFLDSYLHNFTVIFSYSSLYTQAVAYTTYFELGKLVTRVFMPILPNGPSGTRRSYGFYFTLVPFKFLTLYSPNNL